MAELSNSAEMGPTRSGMMRGEKYFFFLNYVYTLVHFLEFWLSILALKFEIGDGCVVSRDLTREAMQNAPRESASPCARHLSALNITVVVCSGSNQALHHTCFCNLLGGACEYRNVFLRG